MPQNRKSKLSKKQDKSCNFEKLGLNNDIALALHLPIRYEDETTIESLENVGHFIGKVIQVESFILETKIQYKPRRQLQVVIGEEEYFLSLRFINFYQNQVKQMSIGKKIRARGEIRFFKNNFEMIHPNFRVISGYVPLPNSLTPVYPLTSGITQNFIRKKIHEALKKVDLTDTLSEKTRVTLELESFEKSIKFLHNPSPNTNINSMLDRSHPAWKRIKFDELLAQQLSMKKARINKQNNQAPIILKKGNLTLKLVELLPFTLTNSQIKVFEEIRSDLNMSIPMQRLLQGDVGCGKTIIATLASTLTIDSGYQSVIMAPTEILAEQHYIKIKNLLKKFTIKIIWLTGSLKKKDKDHARNMIKNGEADLIIGTHALIQKDVDFYKLGLIIVDEQHRFGVSQRLLLRNKGTNTVPHQLMMSATPIPRTLAMTFYADLDISIIDELPPGRKKIETVLISQKRREEIIERVKIIAKKGHQVYWVCPLINDSEKLQLQTATNTFLTLKEHLYEFNVSLIHGKLKSEEKQMIMQDFQKNKVNVLVATSVIEVGVDVPNASLMIIEHSERFGLSQLHQLRGRVGRGKTNSFCVLMYQEPLGIIAKKRLITMKETSDGFEIAKRDLNIRGPGEFLGAKQSGLEMLKFADLEIDQILVDKAKKTANNMLYEKNKMADKHLIRWFGLKTEYSKV